MERFLSVPRLSAAALAVALLAAAADAAALDAYQDRRGAFFGLGLGGGAAIQGGEVGGEAGFDLQIGGGAGKRVTIALDLDTRMQRVAGATSWQFSPGPQIDLFILGGLFVGAGVGIAFVFPDDDLRPEDDFEMGFDGMVGLGYEFFLGSNAAIDLGLYGDVVVIDNMDDAFAVGFWLGFRYY